MGKVGQRYYDLAQQVLIAIYVVCTSLLYYNVICFSSTDTSYNIAISDESVATLTRESSLMDEDFGNF